MKKIFFLFALLITIQGCGFSPVYFSNENINLQIKSVAYEGDQGLNNYMNINLKKYISKNFDDNAFTISTTTKYSKEAQTKDTKGNIQTFKVKSTVIFLVTGNNQTLNLVYTEQADLNNSDDTFELKSYENSIKQNFASSIIEKLILDLSNKQ